jgi:hypothetical protein
MKSIPFKCKFGHVTIAKFQDSEEKPSSIMCSTCATIGHINITVFSTSRRYKSEYMWKSDPKNPVEERAMRF